MLRLEQLDTMNIQLSTVGSSVVVKTEADVAECSVDGETTTEC